MRTLLAALASIGAVIILIISLASCGSTAPAKDAAPDHDGSITADAGPTGPDNREITNAAGTVSGGEYTVEFQLGHWFSQKPTAGGNTQTEGAAAVKP